MSSRDAVRRPSAPAAGLFDAEAQRARVSAFLRDILAGRGARS